MLNLLLVNREEYSLRQKFDFQIELAANKYPGYPFGSDTMVPIQQASGPLQNVILKLENNLCVLSIARKYLYRTYCKIYFNQ